MLGARGRDPGAPHGAIAVITQRRDAPAIDRRRRRPMRASHAALVAARRRSAIRSGVASRQASKSGPGATSPDARVQSVESEIAVRDRRPFADRSRRPGPAAGLDDPAAAGVDEQERREVRRVRAPFAVAALAVPFEGVVIASTRFVGGHGRVRVRCARDPSRGARRSSARDRRRPDLLVADGDAVLVDSVLGPPQPGRMRATNAYTPGSATRDTACRARRPPFAVRVPATPAPRAGGRSEFFANTIPARCESRGSRTRRGRAS